MALCVSQTRDETRVKIPWSWWHLGIMLNGTDFPGLKETGCYVATEHRIFTVEEQALWIDGEPDTLYKWEILPGDVLEMWRDR